MDAGGIYLGLSPLLAAVAADAGTAGLLLQAALMLLLLLLSGLYSGSEAVLFSLTPAQIHHASTSPNPLRRLVAACMAVPQRTLMIILVTNTAVNVLLFSSSYVFYNGLAQQSETLGPWISIASAIFSVLLVVVFGEVVPKVLGVSLADRVAPVSAILVKVASYPFGVVGALIDWVLVRPVHRLLFPQSLTAGGAHAVSPDELRMLLDLNRRRGLLTATEDMMLREVINLGDIRVRDVMVPRVEAVAFDLNRPRNDLITLMRQTRLKKVPVYDGDIDDLVGLIYAKKLFFTPAAPLRELVTPVHYVPELITCEQVLHHFRNTHSQLAFVVDEYGGIAGLVTLEDVLEEIVGEIHDPDDAPERPEVEQISETEYVISGGLSVHYWAQTFALPRFPDRVATVGGLVTARLGRPPRVGDRVRLANVELEVREVARRRVQRLRLRLVSPEEAP